MALLPQNAIHFDNCKRFVEEKFQTLPDFKSEVKPYTLPPNTVLYVVHPVKKRVKIDGKFQKTNMTHVSRPIDVYKEASTQDKKGYRTLDVGKLAQIVTSVCDNEPAGFLFRGQLSGESKENPHALLLKVTDQ